MNPFELIREYATVRVDVRGARLDGTSAKSILTLEKRKTQLEGLIRNIGWKIGFDDMFRTPINEENSKWIQRGVKVYRAPPLRKEATDLAIRGFRDMISDVGLDFQIQDGGVFYNEDKIGRYGNILLFNSSLDGVVWGRAEFGQIQIPVHHLPDVSYLRKVVKHETGHFLGYSKHHEDFPNTKLGYVEPGECVMLYHIPTLNLCDKCRDSLIYAWMFKGEVDGHQYFRKPQPATYLVH